MSLSSGERELKSDFTQASEQVRGSLSSGERELKSQLPSFASNLPSVALFRRA